MEFACRIAPLVFLRLPAWIQRNHNVNQTGTVLTARSLLPLRFIATAVVCFAAILVAFWPQAAHAQYTDTTIYSFCVLSGCADGANPGGALVADPQGNLYGTTLVGGAYDQGTIYELTPQPGGGAPWTNTLLYSFCPQGPPCADGE